MLMQRPSLLVSRSKILFKLLAASIFFSCCLVENTTAHKQFLQSEFQIQIPGDSVVSQGDFSLFIPSSVPDTGLVSLVLFFDPQAEGEMPVRLYSGLARKRNLVLAGSNRCKNGLPLESAIELGRKFYERINALFPNNRKRIYLAGFSGGAVLASALASALPGIKGLIYAAAPGIQIPSCPAIGITGLADPNFHEMVAIQDHIPDHVPHCLRYWEGKHSWPETDCMVFAFDWIKTMETKESTASQLIKNYSLGCSENCSVFEKEEAMHSRWFLSSTLGIGGDDSLRLVFFRKSPEFLKYKQSQITQRKEQEAMKQFYQTSFLEKGISWWKQETGRLHKAGTESWSHQRQLGYLSLLAWSFSTNALKQRDSGQVVRFLEIYRLVDPENPEPQYLEAVFQARNGNRISTEKAIRSAVKLGFSDKIRLLNQPEFKGMGFHALIPD